MKKTLALLVALALFAGPVVAQSSPAETEGRWIPTLDRLQELPVLGWLIGLVTQDDEPEEAAEPPSPESEDGNTLVLDPVDGAEEARGGWTPWG